MHAYAGATDLQVIGPETKRGSRWNRLSGEAQLQLLNEARLQDGLAPIGVRQFYRVKRESRAAGLLRFSSSAWRRRDRHKQRAQRPGGNGLRMVVVALPFAVSGRRPRKLNVSPVAPPINVSPVAHLRPIPQRRPQVLNNRENLKEQRSGSATREKNCGRLHREFPENVIEAEKELSRIAEVVSDEAGHPWKALPEKWSWRCATIEKTIGTNELEDYPELGVELVGLAVGRGRDINRANEHGEYHDFWQVADGDIVARVLTYDASWADTLWQRGSRWLWNRYRIDCEAEGFGGIQAPPPTRQEQIKMEAAVGA